MRLRTWALGVLGGVAASIVMVLAAASPALAHATPISSDPPDGAILARAPTSVSVTFDQPVQPVPSDIEVLSPAGAKVSGAVTGNGPTVDIALKPLIVKGTYTISWRVISADSHPVQGVVTFSYGHLSKAAAAPAGNTNPTVSGLFAIARFLGYAGFAALAGSVAFCCYGYPGAARLRGVRLLILVGWAVAVVGTAGALVLQGPYAAGDGLGRVTDLKLLTQTLATSYGTAMTVRLLVLSLALSPVAYGLDRLARGVSTTARIGYGSAGAVLAVVVAATWAVSGHANTSSERTGTLPADVAHLCAMALWLGGLATVAIVARAQDELALSGIERFSSVAAWSVTILAGTGSYLGWLRVETLPALLTTSYGLTLLVKVSVVGAILCVAFFSRRALHRTLLAVGRDRRKRATLPRRFGWLVTAEAAGALLVLSATALLVEEEPASQAFTAQPAVFTAAYNAGGPGGAGRLQIRLPNQALGLTEANVSVLNADGKPRGVPQISASWTLPARALGPYTAAVYHTGRGRYLTTSAPLTFAGLWELDITIRTDAIDETTVKFPVTIR